jgi:pyruvate,water dikinase
MTEKVQALGEIEATELTVAGGKGSMLAWLYQSGYPVPDGFVILPGAFAGDKLGAEAWAQVQTHLDRLRQSEDETAAFAIRSSAISEDSARASFAGEFETVLDVHTDEAIQAAIHTVRHSRHSERVKAYSQIKGMDKEHEMAVVVQRLIRADISGVLFTANPVTGSRLEMMGNFVYGFGEELVSGEAEPYTFTLERPGGKYEGPDELKRFAHTLYKTASRLEGDLDHPQDIEWCVADGKLYLLQSRPITTLSEHDPITGEWNATLSGDYLWTNMLVGEVFPEATTPSTWSVWQGLLSNLTLGDTPTVGNIAGRPYLNYSLMYGFMRKFIGSHEKIIEFTGDSIGVPPEGTEIPHFPISIKVVALQLLPREIKNAVKKARMKKQISEYLEMVREHCQAWQYQISGAKEPQELMPLWREQIDPLFREVHILLDALNEDLQGMRRGLKNELTALAGAESANMLLTTISGDPGELASLGPLVGLSKLQLGEIDRDEYLRRYGHRTSNENELAEPRPYEDPNWIDRQLAAFSQSPTKIGSLQARRRSEFEIAWKDVERRTTPKKARAIRHKIDRLIETNTHREATRSELTRVVGVIRALFLRAGEFTGLADNVFYLTIDQVDAVLSGDRSATTHIQVRRETYDRLRSLPPLPAWIRGRFDPFLWAADPNRRTDLYDASAPLSLAQEVEGAVRGHPGSAGRVEGLVRRIDSPEQADQLQPGEILVTSTTNVGWTPLFPQAAAIVTDIGAALSHAAIVAREVGIPAVVGCGDATMRLRTGDRVLVDGSRGTVEVLSQAEA